MIELNGGSNGPTASDGLDWSDALAAVAGDRRLLRIIVEAMLVEWPRQMDAIREAISAGDGPTLRRAAHTLKSSAQYFAADSNAYEVAYRLEAMGRDQDFRQADEVLTALEGEIARLMPLLLDYPTGTDKH